MANQWLRLWHDMPNDPKWRTVARISKQPISVVISVYLHVLVNASNATERGRTQHLQTEDIASALDVETDQVHAILEAFQGRVLEGDKVTGWDKRQPAREDGAAERAKAWRDKKKLEAGPQEDDSERNRTQPNADERPDTDTDTEINNTPLTPQGGNQSVCDHVSETGDLFEQPPNTGDKKTKPKREPKPKIEKPDSVPQKTWDDFVIFRKSKRAPITQTVLDGFESEGEKINFTLEQVIKKCIARNWQGFEARWVEEENNKSPPNNNYQQNNNRSQVVAIKQRKPMPLPGERS